jgi:catechol 2,3-dioxygenase-like lactoylglutathione lyase family enzyme
VIAFPPGNCANYSKSTAQVVRPQVGRGGATVAMNLNQVTLPSKDIARARAFYRRLGFTQIVDSPPRYVRFECPDGEATFSLHLVEGAIGDPGAVVYFECADLDETYLRLVARGFAFESAPTDQPWLWREAYLRDPDRNLLCFFQAGQNRRHPPWRLASSGAAAEHGEQT